MPKKAGPKQAGPKKAGPKKTGPDGQRAGAAVPGERDSYHHGDLRRALLAAAVTLVEREGRQALTLRAAARLAGVSQAAPYRHFPDKEALLAAVAEHGMRTLATRMREEAAPYGDDPTMRFQALGVAYVKFAIAHTAHFRVMFTTVSPEEGAHPALSRAADEVFGQLLEVIVACQRDGLVREGDAGELALSAWSIVHGLAELEAGGQIPRLGLGRLGIAQLAERVTRTLFVGLAKSTRPVSGSS